MISRSRHYIPRPAGHPSQEGNTAQDYMKKILWYNPKLKQLSKELRKQGILSEVILWDFLKNKKMRGFGFNRQKPIDEYIVDFYCAELDLVIEIDGISHGAKIAYDEYRDHKLKSLGLSVLHFDDYQVKKDVDSVLMAIDWWIVENMAK